MKWLLLCIVTLALLGLSLCVNLPKLSMEQRNALRKGFQHRYGSFLLRQSGFGADNDGLSNDRLLHFWATEAVNCTRHKVCNSLDPLICADVCKAGTVLTDPWVSNALATQRKLQLDIPLNYASMLGTHNSAISKAYGYGISEGTLTELLQYIDSNWLVYIADQQLALEDQFNLGVRHFELDIHWLDGFIRICHAGGIHIKYLDDLIKWISKETGIPIEWDSETIGCFSPYDRHLNTTFKEIINIINKPQNKEEFSIFYFDDQEDLLEWKKVELIMEGISYYFGDSAFTPVDKAKYFPDRWPTTRELLSLNKQVMFVSRVDYAAAMASYCFSRDSLWLEYSPDDIKAFPVCTLRGIPTNKGNMTRVLGDSLIYGPFHEGYSPGGLLMPNILSQDLECNANFPVWIKPAPRLLQLLCGAGREPSLSNGCTVQAGKDGRWATNDCEKMVHPSACRSTANPNAWAVSQGSAAWSESPACPQGYAFAVPANALQNAQLRSIANGSTVWLNWPLTMAVPISA